MKSACLLVAVLLSGCSSPPLPEARFIREIKPVRPAVEVSLYTTNPNNVYR